MDTELIRPGNRVFVPYYNRYGTVTAWDGRGYQYTVALEDEDGMTVDVSAASMEKQLTDTDHLAQRLDYLLYGAR